MRSAQQRFFKPLLETQHITFITKDYIVDLLTTTVEQYDNECRESAPSKAAIKRKLEFLMKIAALTSANNLLEQNNAFTHICEFYLQNRNSGRLLNNVGKALIYIFNLQTQTNLLDQQYISKVKRLKDPHDPDYITSNRMRPLVIMMSNEERLKSINDLLEKTLLEQIKYSNYIVATYENVRPQLGNDLTEIVANYIPR